MTASRVVFDGMQLAVRHGAARTVRYVLPELARFATDLDLVVLTTEEGREYLGPDVCESVIVPPMSNSAWEQIGLPWHARRAGAKALYTLRALGPTWAPPTLLHFTDEPSDVASSGATATTSRERLVRLYQRTLLGPGLHRAAVVATFTDTIAARLRQRYGNSLPGLEVIPLGVDMRTFYPDSAPTEDVIFHLGSWEPRDETVAVVHAYAKALQAAPDLPDLVIGGELAREGELALQAARSASVENRVRFLGYVADSDLRSCFARAAFCVQPSRYEGFGLMPLEAIACGAALIATEEPAVREVVRDGAVLVANSDPGTIAGAMCRLWSEPSLRANLRLAGLERAREFTWTSTAEKIHLLLQRILAGSAM
jgi:glycosyltransferase involved in cell wall biosynthesis